MARLPLTLSAFGFAAAAGVAALVVHPIPAAAVVVMALFAAFVATLSLRDGAVEDEAEDRLIAARRESSR